jgi:hypothetical protein
MVRLSILFTIYTEKYAEIGQKRLIFIQTGYKLKILLKDSNVIVLKLLKLFSSPG